jgi:hypothetical protein
MRGHAISWQTSYFHLRAGNGHTDRIRDLDVEFVFAHRGRFFENQFNLVTICGYNISIYPASADATLGLSNKVAVTNNTAVLLSILLFMNDMPPVNQSWQILSCSVKSPERDMAGIVVGQMTDVKYHVAFVTISPHLQQIKNNRLLNRIFTCSTTCPQSNDLR